MTRNRDVSEEELKEIIEDLEDKLIIVEGKRDKKALKTLGLKNIITIKGRPLYEIMEEAKNSGKEIVILTDFDKEGREIEKKLKTLLRKFKKRVNSRLRGKVMNLGKNCIEDLANLGSLPNLKEVDIHVKVSTHFNKIRNSRSNKRKRGNRET